MAKCRRCSTALEGRRQLCDPCKGQRPGTADTVATRKGRKPKPKAGKTASSKPAAKTFPDGLRTRGQALWSDLGCEEGTTAGALALEICRSADRLDELDRIIAGKGVLQLMVFRLDPDWFDADGDQHVTVNVKFQSVLSEARQQQGTFKELVKQFNALQSVAAPKGGGAGTAPSSPPAPVASGLDEVSARRAAREQASGSA